MLGKDRKRDCSLPLLRECGAMPATRVNKLSSLNGKDKRPKLNYEDGPVWMSETVLEGKV